MNIKDIIWDKVVVKCPTTPSLDKEYRQALVSVLKFNTAAKSPMLHIRASNGYDLGFYGIIYTNAVIKEISTNYMKISATWYDEDGLGKLNPIPVEVDCYF